MKRLLVLFSLFMFLMSNVYAAPDNLKIGVVNMDQVLQKSALATSYNNKLIADFKPKQNDIMMATKKLQDDLDNLNFNSYKMSITDRNNLQTKINNERRDIDLMNATFQKDLSTAQTQYTQDLMKKLTEVIAKIAKDGKYDIIQTNANILFLNNQIDLTQQVIDQLK